VGSERPPAFADWSAKLAQAVAGWSHAVHVAMVRIDETPHALWYTVPAESHYQGCLTAFKPFDDLIRTFMQTSQCAITFDHTPQPTAPDLDLDVYKGTDKAAKWIEWKRSSRSAGSRSSLARGIEGAIPVPLATGASSS